MEGLEVSGCFTRDGELASYMVTWTHERVCHGLQLHWADAFKALHPTHALYFETARERMGRSGIDVFSLGRQTLPAMAPVDRFKEHAGFPDPPDASMHSPPSIVITQREGFSRSRESLLSVLTHTPKPYELIYVDGASPPEVRDELRRLSEERGFRLLRHERYLSPNEAREAALPFESGEYTAFLDNDVLVAEG